MHRHACVQVYAHVCVCMHVHMGMYECACVWHAEHRDPAADGCSGTRGNSHCKLEGICFSRYHSRPVSGGTRGSAALEMLRFCQIDPRRARGSGLRGGEVWPEACGGSRR